MQVLEAGEINRPRHPVIITHNAAIRKMAHRVIYVADGNVASVEVNESRIEPREIEW